MQSCGCPGSVEGAEGTTRVGVGGAVGPVEVEVVVVVVVVGVATSIQYPYPFFTALQSAARTGFFLVSYALGIAKKPLTHFRNWLRDIPPAAASELQSSPEKMMSTLLKNIRLHAYQ